jgi:RNA polymerase sigma-70 factor (ECF subfamily)
MATNEELFQEWQGGKADALATLVRRYHAPLVAHLYRLLGDAQLAEDLAQDTFFRLVRNARSYRYPHPFLPWLYRIARNLALTYQGSAYHRYVDSVADLPETLIDDADPQVWVERQERHADLLKALEYLSFEQREVLSLRFGQELSVKETAEVLGLPAGTVKSRTASALRQLRTYLEPTSLSQTERRS